MEHILYVCFYYIYICVDVRIKGSDIALSGVFVCYDPLNCSSIHFYACSKSLCLMIQYFFCDV